MKTHEVHALRKAVRRLVEAEVSFSWRGICEPSEMHEIEQERYVATCEFDALIDKLTEDPEMKVYVAIYEHRHGMDVYDTLAGAEAWREHIARDNWERVSDDPLPEDDCADEYFDLVSQEWFRIEECHVNGSKHD